jgi:hypothetical protein
MTPCWGSALCFEHPKNENERPRAVMKETAKDGPRRMVGAVRKLSERIRPRVALDAFGARCARIWLE